MKPNVPSMWSHFHGKHGMELAMRKGFFFFFFKVVLKNGIVILV
jgi:hypothetical protein